MPAGKTAVRALQRYIRRERKASRRTQEVFVTRHGHPLTPDYLAQKIRRLARSAGIEREYVGPHALRHGFALQYLLNGGDLFHLKETLGHASIQMTEKYVRLLPRHLQQPHAKFSPVERM